MEARNVVSLSIMPTYEELNKSTFTVDRVLTKFFPIYYMYLKVSLKDPYVNREMHQLWSLKRIATDILIQIIAPYGLFLVK